MKKLLLIVALLLGSSMAFADCPWWTTYQIDPNTWICGHYGPNGEFMCYNPTICVNPDGSESQAGDIYWLFYGYNLPVIPPIMY